MLLGHRKLRELYEMNSVLDYFEAFLDARVLMNFVLGICL